MTDRHGHSLSVVTISSHCVWLVTFGGRNSEKALCDTNVVELGMYVMDKHVMLSYCSI